MLTLCTVKQRQYSEENMQISRIFKGELQSQNKLGLNKRLYFFSCGPKSYFTLFYNLIGYASGPYEPVRTARDLKP
jgi:hypothetical protein